MVTETSTKMQYVGTFTILLLMFANGSSNGWNSPSLPSLLAANSPLDSGPLNLDQAAWVAANICLGSIVGAPLFGWMNDKVGRKATAYAASLIQLVSNLKVFQGFTGFCDFFSPFLMEWAIIIVLSTVCPSLMKPKNFDET